MTAAPQRPSQPLSIAIVAAEESGDALGAALARALVKAESAVQLTGVGGNAMMTTSIARSGLLPPSVLSMSVKPPWWPVAM